MKPPVSHDVQSMREACQGMDAREVFTPGSWWLLDDRPCVAGTPRGAGERAEIAAQRNVYLYPLPSSAAQAKAEPLPAQWLTLAMALEGICSGRLRPSAHDDLSAWSEAEIDWYRRA
jgi:hypothetical protein